MAFLLIGSDPQTWRAKTGLKDSESHDFLGADDDLLLQELPFEPLAEGPPEFGCEFTDDDLDDRDVVTLGRVAAAPQAICRGADVARRPAELVGQFCRNLSNHSLETGSPFPVSFGTRFCTT